MTRNQLFRSMAVVAVAVVLSVMLSPVALAQGVVSQWKMVPEPPAPELKAVKVDPQKTALLVMDFNDALCTSGSKDALPRCVKAIPEVKKLIEEARVHHMLVVFTGYPDMKPVVKELAPMRGEPMVVAHADKFVGTDLGKVLTDHGITTVIATGVVANGCVLFTTIGAADRGYKVIVPVDTMPGRSAYAEQSTIWHIANDMTIGRTSTLTSVAMISF
jgi:nicotinamidase-related amidase